MVGAAERGYAKGRAKRAEIIERATRLFGESGYRGTSLREIAAGCGISHPGLLHHFPTKDALLIAVLEHRGRQAVERFFPEGLSGLDQLRHLVRLVEQNTKRRGIIELYAVLSAEATAPGHPAHEFFVQRYRTTVARVANAFDLASTEHVLRAGVVPHTAATALVALMDGAQLQWLLDGSTPVVDIVRQQVQDRLTVPL
jgi:AcrR family transcriptional regulator